MQNASDSARLTNMQSKHTRHISQTTRTLEMQKQSTQKEFQTLIYSVQDFLVKHSALLEKGKVSKIPEAHCFLKLQESLRLKDLRLYCLKTSKVYSITRMGKLTESSLKHWMNWGMTLNGWSLTARTSKLHRTEKECSLSEFIETSPARKYYLSEHTLKYLIKRIRKGWNSSMTETIKAKEYTQYQELLQQYPQAKQEEITFRLLQKYIRRLTPLETERLQGFPDHWTEGQSDNQRYTQCGNAVTVPVVENIMYCIIEELQ